MRYRKNLPLADLSVYFFIPRTTVSRVIDNILFHELKHSTAIPFLFSQELVDLDVRKTLKYLRDQIPPLMQEIAAEFVDPTGRGRQCVIGLMDATYLFMQKPSDLELQKITFYSPKSHNVLKLLDITSCKGGYAAIMPLASSISPTSGDIHLIDAYIRATDEIQEDEPYYHPNSPLRILLRGTEELFLHLVTDAGFAQKPANRVETTIMELKTICAEEGALFTSTKV